MLGNPKGNLKPLKLKNIYENRKPKKKVIRISENNIKKSIERVLKERHSLNEIGGYERKPKSTDPAFIRNLPALYKYLSVLLDKVEEIKIECIGGPIGKVGCDDLSKAAGLKGYWKKMESKFGTGLSTIDKKSDFFVEKTGDKAGGEVGGLVKRR